MQRLYLKMNKITIVSLYVLQMLYLSESCMGKNVYNTSKSQLKKIENIEDSVFNCKQYLKEISGTYICYKYERDGRYYADFEVDSAFNEEFARYFYITIKNDTISSNIYKMPIKCERIALEKLTTSDEETFYNMSSKDSSISEFKVGYRIRGVDNLYYSRYQKTSLEKGDTLPYIKRLPIGGIMWSYPKYIAFNDFGYYWFFKRGEPINKDIIGMPSNISSRFIVNRTYLNCTIKDAVYKMIADFPKGTEGLLAFSDEPNMNGEIERWFPEESCFNYGESTQYIWHKKDSVTVKIHETKNSTFIFEFVKVGNDVEVKYYNDVVFPFEKGYKK